MELLNEIENNPVSDIKKEEESTLLKENVKKYESKKKFYNTVFATKMRNRRKEEKLDKPENKEVSTLCKSVAKTEVTTVSPHTESNSISSREHQNHAKKISCKTDQTNVKKQVCDNDKKIVTLQMEDVGEIHSEDNNDKICDSETEDEIVNKESINEDQLEISLDKDDVQRRKSIRQVTPTTFFDEKWDVETKPDNGAIAEEEYSCRRTEKFVGKLNTREARILNIEKIVKEKSEPTNQNNNTLVNVNESENDLLTKSEDKNISITNESVSEANKNIKSYNTVMTFKSNESKNSTKCYKNLKDNIDKEDLINRCKDKSMVNTLKNTDMEVTSINSKRLSEKVIETKENINVEVPTCRRIVPFVNQNSQSALSSTSEKFIEIDCVKSDANTKLESSKNKKIKSKFSLEPDSLKDGSKLKCSAQDGDLKIDSSSESEIKANLCNNAESDSLPNVSLKAEDPLSCDDNEKNLTCQRIKPYLGKNYPNCSRTLPFIDLVGKVKSQDTAGTSTKLPNNTSSSHGNVPNRLQLNDSDKLKEKLKRNENSNIPEKVENELVNTVTNGTSDESVKTGEWKFRRKRSNIKSDNAQQVIKLH
jgi:hypothetical protein